MTKGTEKDKKPLPDEVTQNPSVKKEIENLKQGWISENQTSDEITKDKPQSKTR